MSVASWPKVRIRFVSKLNPSKSEIEHLSRDTEVTFLPMDAIGDDGSIRLDSTRTLAVVDQGYTYLRDGDVTIAKITPCFENGKGALMSGLLGGIGLGTTELIVVRPNHSRITGSFLNWLFISPHFRKTAEAAMYGAGGQKRVPDNFVRDFAILLPTLVEQTAIVAFLDRETYKIDALVAEQERLIALLKEKRQAVISHAVTNGLNPNASMKDSGVDWLGEVPAHWHVARIAHYAAVVNGSTPSRDNPAFWAPGSTIPWVSSGEVNQVVIVEPSAFITADAVRSAGLRMIPAGSVLVGLVGQGRTRGMAAILQIESTINQNVAAIIPRSRLNGEYAHLVIQVAYDVLRDHGRGGNQAALNCEILAAFRIPVPPISEQVLIAGHVERELVWLTALLIESERAIALLHERRAALISAAVTGKIDVRDIVPVAAAA